MYLLYNLSIFLYRALIFIVAPFVKKASLFQKGRKGWKQQLDSFAGENKGEIVWFHCASLGEFEQGRPLIEAWKKDFPTDKIVLTFFSPSGYEVRKGYSLADLIMYLPTDTAANAEHFVKSLNLKAAFFVKYEFWHHFLKVLEKKGVPIYSVSAIFRKDQIFFKPYGGFNRKILFRFDHFFVQNETSLKLLNGIGIGQVSLAGDTRFDRVAQIVDARKEIKEALVFKNGKKAMVCGSVWPPDWELLAVAWGGKPPIKLIIAPHEINEGHLKAVEMAFSKAKTVRFSSIAKNEVSDLPAADILLIDNIGMLSSLYAYGELAYIGGGFGSGLHNTLEAATYGIPILFGKKYQKFQEAVELVGRKGAFSVENVAEFNQVFSKLINDVPFYEHASQTAGNYVKNNVGATQFIIDFVKNDLGT